MKTVRELIAALPCCGNERSALAEFIERTRHLKAERYPSEAAAFSAWIKRIPEEVTRPLA